LFGSGEKILKDSFTCIQDLVLVAIQRWKESDLTFVRHTISITIAAGVVGYITTISGSICVTVQSRLALGDDLGTGT
jgi:CheY-specific phosphatase CheX